MNDNAVVEHIDRVTPVNAQSKPMVTQQSLQHLRHCAHHVARHRDQLNLLWAKIGDLVTNEKAQVLHRGGEIIEVLCAAGNISASVMGNTYPGAGSTIGPAMTFGYIAAKHAAGNLE